MSQTLGPNVAGPRWMHIAYVRDGDSHCVLLNGDIEIQVIESIQINSPAVLVSYANIIADASLPSTTRQSALTGLKSWSDALTKLEIQSEIYSSHRAARRENLWGEVYLTEADDLHDHSGGSHNIEVDLIKPGYFLKTAGPHGAMPLINRMPIGFASKGTSVVSSLDGRAIGDAIGLRQDFAPTSIDAITVMGWFLVPTTTGPTQEVPLFRIANDDSVGGTKEISVSITTAGKLALNLGLMPQVSAGPSQTLVPPLPAVANLIGTVAGGGLFQPESYQWELIEHPDAETLPVLGTPTTLTTTASFSVFEPGTYIFRLTVTFINPRGQQVVVRATTTVVFPQRNAPIVDSGSAQIIFPTDNTTLTPSITDDGWSGPLTYLWEQISGLAGPVIGSPTSPSTLITVPENPQTYVFRLTVTSQNFIGRGFWRVTALTGTSAAEADTVSEVVITIGAVPYAAQLGDLNISESPNENSNTCQIKVFNPIGIEIFEEAIVTMGIIRIFAGNLLRLAKSFKELPDNIFWTLNLVGYEWQFQRRRVTKRYVNQSLTDIALNLIAMVPGFTSVHVDLNLPIVAEMTFKNLPIGDALTEVAKSIPGGGQWKVDYERDVHLGAMETSDPDPTPLTIYHPSFRDLTISKDGSQIANRVISDGGGSNAAADADIGASEIQVMDLDWFSETGGKARSGTQRFTYTGVRIDDGRGQLPGEWDDLSYTGLLETVLFSSVGDQRDGGGNYFITGVTEFGETMSIDSFGVATSLPFFGVQMGPASFSSTVPTLYYNIYRAPATSTAPLQDARFVGSLYPGDTFLDQLSDAAIADNASLPTSDTSQSTQAPISGINDPVTTYFLTGVSGLVEVIKNGDPINVYAQVDDVAAQTALAALLGGGDDGVVEAYIEDPNITEEEALTRATAYIEEHSEPDEGVGWNSKDQNTHPGQFITVNLPAPASVSGDFKIQEVEISEFEQGIAPRYQARASLIHTSLERILAERGRDTPDVNTGGSSSSTGPVSGAGSRSTPGAAGRLFTFFDFRDLNNTTQTDGGQSMTNAGAEALVIDADGAWARYNAAATAGAGRATSGGWTWWDYKPIFKAVFRVDNTFLTTLRYYAGIHSASGLFANDDNRATERVCAVRYSTAASDPGWVVVTADGTTQTVSAQLLPYVKFGRYSVTIEYISATQARVVMTNLDNGAIGTTKVLLANFTGLELNASVNVALSSQDRDIDIRYISGARN